MIMEILAVEGFKIYGLKTRTKNADEINGDGKIPTLWAKFTKEFYDLLFVAVDIYNQIVSDNAEDTVSEYCESAFDYLVFNAGKPIFKITNGDVNVTFKKNKNRKLVYKLECKGNNCLVSDVITENGQSHKQYMKHCIKNYKSPFE